MIKTYKMITVDTVNIDIDDVTQYAIEAIKDYVCDHWENDDVENCPNFYTAVNDVTKEVAEKLLKNS